VHLPFGIEASGVIPQHQVGEALDAEDIAAQVLTGCVDRLKAMSVRRSLRGMGLGAILELAALAGPLPVHLCQANRHLSEGRREGRKFTRWSGRELHPQVPPSHLVDGVPDCSQPGTRAPDRPHSGDCRENSHAGGR